jgi:hypothetical protein
MPAAAHRAVNVNTARSAAERFHNFLDHDRLVKCHPSFAIFF